MSKKIKILLGLIFPIIFLICLFSAYFLQGYGRYYPWSHMEISDAADAVSDSEGNIYVLNNSGYELLKINCEGVVSLVIRGESDNGRGFYRGRDLAIDDEGNIYIHNQIPDTDTPSWIGEEDIVEYDSEGRYLGTYLNIEHDPVAMTESIVALQSIDGDVYAVYVDGDQVNIEDVKGDASYSFQYDNASKLITCANISEQDQAVYLGTKNGKMIKATSAEQTVLYDASLNLDNEKNLWDLAQAADGSIYVCDINNSQVDRYYNGEFTDYYAGDEPTISVDASNSLVFNDSYAIVVQNGEQQTEYSEISLSGRMVCIYLLMLLCLVIAGIFIIITVIEIIYLIVKNDNAKFKRVLLFGLLILGVSAAFCMLISKNYRTTILNNRVDREVDAASEVERLMDPEWFKGLTHVSDYYSDNYLNIKDVVDNVMLNDGVVPDDYYLVMYTYDVDTDVMMERYSLSEDVGCAYRYIWSDGEYERLIYETGETYVFDETSDVDGIFQCIYYPITDEDGSVIGIIEVGANCASVNSEINSSIMGVGISVLALGIVFLLIMLEVIEFNEGSKGIKLTDLKTGSITVPIKLYRAAVFLIFFITNITTPFLSIYALKLAEDYTEVLGISAEILAAVPISAEVLAGAIFSLLGGNIISKFGLRRSGIAGALLFTLGLMIRFVYPNLWVITLGNLVQGAGWGIVLLIVNAKIASEKDEKLQEQGFTDYVIAQQNGINSGMVFGGFLLGFAGYTAILITVAVLSLGVLVYMYYLVYDSAQSLEGEQAADTEGAGNNRGLLGYLRFIFRPKVITYFLCIVIPIVSASYYLNFLYPIIADDLGISENMIGYSYLFNGLVMICFGNLIVNFMSRFFDRKKLLMIASLIYLVTFVLVGMFESIPIILLSLVLIAISDSFGYVAQSTFYTELKETEDFGYEKAMGVYSLFENLSQTIGSFIFGYILIVGVKSGMSVYGIIIGVLGVIFALLITVFSRKRKEV